MCTSGEKKIHKICELIKKPLQAIIIRKFLHRDVSLNMGEKPTNELKSFIIKIKIKQTNR